jgi:hypothetical protein
MLGPRYVSLGGQRNLCAGCNRVPREVQIRPVLSFPRCGETRRLCQLCGESTRFPGLPFACHGQRVRISDATTTTTWNSPTREYIDERKDAMQEGAILQSCDGVAFEQREWERGVQDSSSSSAGRLVAALPNFDDGARAARNRSQLPPWPPPDIIGPTDVSCCSLLAQIVRKRLCKTTKHDYSDRPSICIECLLTVRFHRCHQRWTPRPWFEALPSPPTSSERASDSSGTGTKYGEVTIRQPSDIKHQPRLSRGT